MDTNYQKEEEYYKAKVRVLVCFPSPASNKAVSMTSAVINSYVKESCPGVFIDFCYAPEPEDLKQFDNAGMPYLIGNITHLDASHYDYVGFSISILFESIGSAWLLKSLSRCDTPIPLTWTERKDLPLGSVPVIYAGGITCSVADILFGNLGDGRQAFLDFLYLGEVHRSFEIWGKYPLHKEKGVTIQEHINRLWQESKDGLDFLYQPQAYEVKFNDKNQITSNIKVNPFAPDMCKPYYPDEMPDSDGSALGIVMGDGGNVDIAQIQAANGCSRTGACNFCLSKDTPLFMENGVKKWDEIKVGDKIQTGLGVLRKVQAIYDMGTKPVLGITLNDGSLIKVTGEHHMYLSNGEMVEAKSLKVGDALLTDIAIPQKVTDTTEFLSYAAGYFIGAGRVHFSSESNIPYRASVRFWNDEEGLERQKGLIHSLDSCGINYSAETYLTRPCVKVNGDGIKKMGGLYKDTNALCEEIRSYSKQKFMWFLSGLIASCGKNVGDKWAIYLDKETLARDIYALCGYHSVEARFDTLTSLGYAPVYRITGTVASLKDFTVDMLNMVGGLLGKKLLRRKYGILKPNKKLLGFITKIEPLGDEEVFDITVEDVHRFKCVNNVIVGNCHEGWYCIPAGTGIKTSKGITNIEDIKAGDKVVVDGKEYKALTSAMERGVKPTQRIELSTHQTIDVAVSHLMQVIDDGKLVFKRAWDLKKGDYLVYDHSQSFGNFSSKYAYLIGLILGDGFIRKDEARFWVRMPVLDMDSSISEEFDRHFTKWAYSSEGKEVVSAVAYSKEAWETFYSMGMVGKIANTKRIPKEFFNSDKKTAIALLQGLFDLEGCVSLTKSNKASVSYCSVNKDLVDDVVRMLSMFGIVSTIHERQSKIRSHISESGDNIKHSEVVFEVVIVGESNINRFSEIGFRLKRKQDKFMSRVPYKYDVESMPTFEDRLKALYDTDKNFNKAVRDRSDVVRKHINGWNSQVSSLSKRHFEALYDVLPDDIKQDYDVAKQYSFYRIDRIETLGNQMMYDIEVEDSHKYSICGWVSHNTGGWVENSRDRLVELAKKGRLTTAASKLKMYSFNTNYLSDYPGTIYKMLGIYPEVSFNNMRLEELGKEKDNIKMMKLSGFQRTAAPLEGISFRIRNGLLNKNLSEESLNSFLEYVMYMGAIDVKVGIVYTGYEEDADWQYLYDWIKKWKDKCRITGGNLPLRLKPTPMIHYPGTPIYYIERKAPKHSWTGEHWIPDKWNDIFYTSGARIKMNGFRFSCFIEQAIVDLGRSATEWMYKYIIQRGTPFYNFRPVAREEVLNALKSLVNYDYFFNARDPRTTISIDHRIHLAMHGAMLYQAMNIYKNGVDAPPVGRCLKTYEGCKVSCKKNIYKDNPLPFYADVEVSGDKLQGNIWQEVEGCNGCKTEEMRKFVLTRPTPKTKSADDILSYKGKPLRQRLRFKIIRQKGYEILSPRNTAFTAIAKILQQSEKVADAFYKVCLNHNMYWQSDVEYNYTVDGTMYVDATFTEDIFDEVPQLLYKVNEESQSFKFEWVKPVDLKDDIKVSDWNIYKFESTLPAELWTYCTMQYKGEVRVLNPDGVFHIGKDEQLIKPSFAFRSKVEGYFAVPCKYSPIHYLQGLLSSKRITMNKLLSTTYVTCISTVRESNTTCLCGNEKTIVDLGLNKQQRVGKECMIKLLTKKL